MLNFDKSKKLYYILSQSSVNSSSLAKGYDSGPLLSTLGRCYRRNVNKDDTGMLSYDNDLPLLVLVPMKTSFPSAKALKISLG
jgi:hypothetical protein